MKTTRANIVRKIQDFWPALIDGHKEGGHLWIPRNDYWTPSRKHLEQFIEQDWTQYLEAIDYDLKLFACTNFAALFRSVIDLHVIRLVESHTLNHADMLEWTVMSVWGTRFNGRETSHAINMILMSDGDLWFFEPQQAKELWKANPDQDQIHFVVL